MKINENALLYPDGLVIDRIIGKISTKSFKVGSIEIVENDDIGGTSISIPDSDAASPEALTIVVDEGNYVQINSVYNREIEESNSGRYLACISGYESYNFMSYYFYKNLLDDDDKIISISTKNIQSPLVVNDKIKMYFREETSEAGSSLNIFLIDVPEEFNFDIDEIITEKMVGNIFQVSNGFKMFLGSSMSITNVVDTSETSYITFDFNTKDFYIDTDIKIDDSSELWVKSIAFDGSEAKTTILSDSIATGTMGKIRVPRLSYGESSELWLGTGEQNNFYITSHIKGIDLLGHSQANVGNVMINLKDPELNFYSNNNTSDLFKFLFLNMSIGYIRENEIDNSLTVCQNTENGNSNEGTNDCLSVVSISIPQAKENTDTEPRLVFRAGMIELAELSILKEYVCKELKYIGEYYNANKYEQNENPPHLELKAESEPSLLITDRIFKVSEVQNASFIFANSFCLGSDWSKIYLKEAQTDSNTNREVCMFLDKSENNEDQLERYDFKLNTNVSKKDIFITAGELKDIVRFGEGSFKINGIEIYKQDDSEKVSNYIKDNGIESHMGKYASENILLVTEVGELKFNSIEGGEIFTTSDVIINSGEKDIMKHLQLFVDSRGIADETIIDDSIILEFPHLILGENDNLSIGANGVFDNDHVQFMGNEDRKVIFNDNIIGSHHSILSKGNLSFNTEGELHLSELYVSGIYCVYSESNFLKTNSLWQLKENSEDTTAKGLIIEEGKITGIKVLGFEEIEVDELFIEETSLFNTEESYLQILSGFSDPSDSYIISLKDLDFSYFSGSEPTIQAGEIKIMSTALSFESSTLENYFTINSGNINVNSPVLIKGEDEVTIEELCAEEVIISAFANDETPGILGLVSIGNSDFSYSGKSLKFGENVQNIDIQLSNGSLEIQDNGSRYKIIAENFNFNIPKTELPFLSFCVPSVSDSAIPTTETTNIDDCSPKRCSIYISCLKGNVASIGSENNKSEIGENVELNKISGVATLSTSVFDQVTYSNEDNTFTLECPIDIFPLTTSNSAKINTLSIPRDVTDKNLIFKKQSDIVDDFIYLTSEDETKLVVEGPVSIGTATVDTINTDHLAIDVKSIHNEGSIDSKTNNNNNGNNYVYLNEYDFVLARPTDPINISATKVYPYCGKSATFVFTEKLKLNVTGHEYDNGNSNVLGYEYCGGFPEVITAEFIENPFITVSNLNATAIAFRSEIDAEEPMILVTDKEKNYVNLNYKEGLGNFRTVEKFGFRGIYVDILNIYHQYGSTKYPLFQENTDNSKTLNENFIVHNFIADEITGIEKLSVKMDANFYDENMSYDIAKLSYSTFNSFTIDNDSNVTKYVMKDFTNDSAPTYVFKPISSDGNEGESYTYKVDFENIYIIMFKNEGTEGPKYKFRFVSMCSSINVNYDSAGTTNNDVPIGNIECSANPDLITVRVRDGYSVSVIEMSKESVQGQ